MASSCHRNTDAPRGACLSLSRGGQCASQARERSDFLALHILRFYVRHFAMFCAARIGRRPRLLFQTDQKGRKNPLSFASTHECSSALMPAENGSEACCKSLRSVAPKSSPPERRATRAARGGTDCAESKCTRARDVPEAALKKRTDFGSTVSLHSPSVVFEKC